VLVRHAETAGQSRFLGQHDAPLSAVGRRQLPALANKLHRYAIDMVYCSDLSRATTTAGAIARRLDVPVEVRPSLREMNFGRWEGLSWDEVAEQFPRAARRWLNARSSPSVPGGEPLARFKRRTLAELKHIVADNAGTSVAVVTHGGVIRVVVAAVLGIPDRKLFCVSQPPCAINVIDYFNRGAVVRSINA
jgi:alpha-ribazole phosphatase